MGKVIASRDKLKAELDPLLKDYAEFVIEGT
jgi:hypothetical protein